MNGQRWRRREQGIKIGMAGRRRSPNADIEILGKVQVPGAKAKSV